MTTSPSSWQWCASKESDCKRSGRRDGRRACRGESVSELLRGLPPLLASHLELALVALVLAIVISVPLAVAVHARPRAAFAILTIAGVVQTIPGLALLAL